MNEFTLIQKIALYALPVLFAITLHEVAHGWAAKYFGDRTAESMGRLSLNPLRHIDPIGTLLIPGLALLIGGFLFGWAKPVPVNFGNLRCPKRDMLWVALAGPASNLVMAIVWALLWRFVDQGLHGADMQFPLQFMCQAGVQINISLMVLNLLPLPPLDGGRILVSLLPDRQAYTVSKIEPYGFFILIGLAATQILPVIMQPFMVLSYSFIALIL